ncbi:MAG: SDR family NAD(P)-dependent oxidoreductase [bacterium]|nr:SDR family NAD(P)-dependent oxidoreductase [bacterium]
MSQGKSLEGQVAVVTGGGAGIGLACVERLAREGARVAVLDRDEVRGAAAAEKAAAAGSEGAFFRAEAASADEVHSAFGGALGKWGRLDILVNCAGGFLEIRDFEDLEEDVWDASIAWNLKSVYLCCREAVPVMKKAGYGRIVSISSTAGRTGVRFTAVEYTTAKTAIVGFTRRLAVEFAPHGITVNAVAPGVVLSPRVAELHKNRIEDVKKGIPMGRPGTEHEIADGVWYLASPGASYITGVTLDINGGLWTG